jgi:hypothetical protein
LELDKCFEHVEFYRKYNTTDTDYILFVEGLIDELQGKEYEAIAKYESIQGNTIFSGRAQIRMAVICFDTDQMKLRELVKSYRNFSPEFKELNAYLTGKKHISPWLLKKPSMWTDIDRSKWVSIGS